MENLRGVSIFLGVQMKNANWDMTHFFGHKSKNLADTEL